MRIHQLAVNEAILSLHTGPAGLTSTEAERRLGEFGPNRVDPIRGTPVATRLFRAFAHFFALILWVAAGLAFIAESQEPGSGMRTLGLAILGVILVNGLFTFWQEYRAEHAMVIYGGPATLDGRRLEKITVKPDLSVEAEENAAIKMKIKE